MSKVLQYYIFLCFLTGLSHLGQAQKKEKIKYKADQLEFGKINDESFRKLSGNVVFTQKSTTVYSDTSYFYKDRNIMEAEGHIRIIDDSTTITSKKLIYEGDNRMAKLRDNVVYLRDEQKLYTDFLDYDLDAEIAHYFNKGKLIDTTNVLTSQIGYYFAKDEYAQFYKNVILTTEDFVLKTDTLRYNTVTKIAYTFGPTQITTEDGTVLHANGGEYRTVEEESDFIEGDIETEDYYLEAKQLFFDESGGYYKAITDVKMTAKDEDVIITGDEGYYDRGLGISKVYGHALMKRVLEADTFYLAADTLVAIESDLDEEKRILAYRNVKAYKTGLQGKADSMAYFINDSILFFYSDPIMWNNQNQITSDTISLEVSEDEMKRMNLISDAFLISEDSIENYNQIKGRDMITYFVENEINRIDVDGNGEILYFALEEGDSVLMGMNKIFCASMQIRFQDQKLSSFSVYTNPEAQFIPPHELTKDVQILEGFAWRENERPELFDLAPYLNLEFMETDSLGRKEVSLENDSLPIQKDNKPTFKSVKPTSQKPPTNNEPKRTLEGPKKGIPNSRGGKIKKDGGR